MCISNRSNEKKMLLIKGMLIKLSYISECIIFFYHLLLINSGCIRKSVKLLSDLFYHISCQLLNSKNVSDINQSNKVQGIFFQNT